jgi:hypothetical protein
MKKNWIILGPAVLSLSITGCGVNDNAAVNNNNGGQRVQTNQIKQSVVNNDRDSRTLRIADRAERQVERMKEVDDAHVIIANNNAYVAVRPANNNNATVKGTNNTGNTNNNLDNNGNAIDNDVANGNGRTFIDNGTVNQDNNNGKVNDGIIDGKGDAGVRNRQNTGAGNVGNNNNTIGTGYVNDNNNGVAGNNTGGTATRGNNYTEVSNAFEQKIADQVRKADSKIHKVYVSVNPTLYNRMGTYADDIRANRNRDGLFDDFNDTVNDFFGRKND